MESIKNNNSFTYTREDNTKYFVYLLHFKTKLYHAQHYVGMTGNLKQRLISHSRGTGSNLTRAILDKNINWILSVLYIATTQDARRLERKLKDRKNGPKYCPICSGKTTKIQGAMTYPLTSLPFPIRAEYLRCLCTK